MEEVLDTRSAWTEAKSRFRSYQRGWGTMMATSKLVLNVNEEFQTNHERRKAAFKFSNDRAEVILARDAVAASQSRNHINLVPAIREESKGIPRAHRAVRCSCLAFRDERFCRERTLNLELRKFPA
jgi:hypothetical protein